MVYCHRLLREGTAFIHDDGKFVRIDYGEDGRRAFRGFFGMVAGLAGEGNDVIVDAFLTEPWMVPSAAAWLGGFPGIPRGSPLSGGRT